MVFKKDLIKLKKKKTQHFHTHTSAELLICTRFQLKFIQITNLKRIRLKIFRFTDCLIAWLRESKPSMAGNSFKLTILKRLRLKIFRFTNCLAKAVKILDGMKCSPLFAPIPLDTWKSEIQLSSGIIIMLFLLSYEVHIMLNKSI